jgi:hypothetical protein
MNSALSTGNAVPLVSCCVWSVNGNVPLHQRPQTAAPARLSLSRLHTPPPPPPPAASRQSVLLPVAAGGRGVGVGPRGYIGLQGRGLRSAVCHQPPPTSARQLPAASCHHCQLPVVQILPLIPFEQIKPKPDYLLWGCFRWGFASSRAPAGCLFQLIHGLGEGARGAKSPCKKI